MDLGLRDRVYVVTGGSRGLGFATAQVLVGEGAHVVISSRTQHAITRAAAELGGPEHAVGLTEDNADLGSAERLVAAAVARYGRLDGGLISMGGPPPGALLDTTEEQWRSSFDSLFLGSVRLARAIACSVGDGGSICFVLSTSVRSPIPGVAISNGLRPGLAMVAKTMADELGPRGVRVNGLLPHRIATGGAKELDEVTGDADAARARNVAGIPLRRYGGPEEFARVAAFLLSPAASYLTGVMLPVDGGALRTI